jgi:hypothetical protein
VSLTNIHPVTGEAGVANGNSSWSAKMSPTSTDRKVFGRCANTTGIAAFTNLVTQVMIREPDASADRVFWIVDNGSSHRGQAATDRLAKQYPNAIMVHTPVHASWLNQIEITSPSSNGKCSRPTTSPI